MRNSSGNGNKGGDAFREWLSDRLRYFILLIALLVAVMAITMVSRLIDSNMSRSNRSAGESGAASDVKSEEETQEAVVILSDENAAPQAGQENPEASVKAETEKKDTKDSYRYTQETARERPRRPSE